MRIIIITVLFTLCFSQAAGWELGNARKDTKTNSHVLMNTGRPDGRDGGEDISTAIVIESIPFSDTGNTSDNFNDYDAVCPYSGSTAPDVVYSFTPAFDMGISVDLCGSGYDTKTYIMNSVLEIVACNDDAYFDDTCGVYVSMIEDAILIGGTEYFIVIDGYGEDAGDFTLEIEEYEIPPECVITCSGYPENEPPLHVGYIDIYNSGCNDESGLHPFYFVPGGFCGPDDATICGKAGWYGDGLRDTDWYITEIGSAGYTEWTLDAEQETYGFLLAPQDCATVGVLEQMLVGPCSPQTMTLFGNPGDIVWLWVGAVEFSPPPGFVGHEYDYHFYISGLWGGPGITATEKTSLGRIKSLYR